MEIVFYLAVFCLVFSLTMALLKTFSRYDLYQKRLELLKNNNGVENGTAAKGHSSFRIMISKVSSLFAASSFTNKLQTQLIRAGIPLKGEEYVTLWLAAIILLPLVLYFVSSSNIWLAVIAFLCIAWMPKFYLNYKKDKRLQSLNLQLGDALVIMANALRAGFGFQQAMDTVRKELPAPISAEFSWTLREINLGFNQEEALLNMGKRVESEELDMVISGIIIQRQVGGNLAEVLDNISGTIRERAKIKREVKVLTAQGRLSGLIIGLLPLVLIAVMLVINPSYFSIMITDIRGIFILGTAAILELIGIIIIKDIINIEL
ncbi:MAG: type II secretion system F family protein [Syntrophomonas sp.]